MLLNSKTLIKSRMTSNKIASVSLSKNICLGRAVTAHNLHDRHSITMLLVCKCTSPVLIKSILDSIALHKPVTSIEIELDRERNDHKNNRKSVMI